MWVECMLLIDKSYYIKIIFQQVKFLLQYTVNDEKLAGLKFGESANKSVLQKEERLATSSRIANMYGY